jgi:hypothetical protein
MDGVRNVCEMDVLMDIWREGAREVGRDGGK